MSSNGVRGWGGWGIVGGPILIGPSENKTGMEKIFIHWSNTPKYRRGWKGVVQTPALKSKLTSL